MLAAYRKALAPAALAALAVVVQLVITGNWDRVETAVAFTAFIAAGTTALVPNIPNSGAWQYLKAIVPAFVTFSGTIAIWIQDGSFDKTTLAVFLTGAGTALITLITGNKGNTNEVGSNVGAMSGPTQPLGMARP